MGFIEYNEDRIKTGIAFISAKSLAQRHKSGRCVVLTEKMRDYFIAYQEDFFNYAVVIETLDEYSDTLLQKDDIEQVLKLCDELKYITGDITDYKMYNLKIFNTWKQFSIKKEDLYIFASEFFELLEYAKKNQEFVWACGD